MACNFPLVSWMSRDLDDINPVTGKVKRVFNESLGYPGTRMELPCGKCFGCRFDRARSWAARIMHEASLYDHNMFLTLTYNDDHLPRLPDGTATLNKEDITKFFKRLRKHYSGVKIRYYQVGEYGDNFGRPHHHAIVFNLRPDDLVHIKTSYGIMYYISPTITGLWPLGNHIIGDVTFDSACYCARYILDKVGGDIADEHYNGRMPEYSTMSRRPGIGKDWYDLYKDDLYRQDKCVVNDDFILRPPRYYDNLFAVDNPSRLIDLKLIRREHASNNRNNTDDRRIANYKILRKQHLELSRRKTEEPL